jgi:hypothetical protein
LIEIKIRTNILNFQVQKEKLSMATSSHLASDRVNLLELKEWLRREFLSFFEDVPGKKVRSTSTSSL